jgi:type I restriction enzyme R subunit
MNSVLRPPFVPFDEHKATRIYIRNLPHWRQQGATYFMTFRLGDAIPVQVANEIEEKRRQRLAARSIADHENAIQRLSSRDRFLYRKYVNRLQEGVADAGHGACYLRKSRVLDVVRNRLHKLDGSEYHLGDFVIMANHVHVLLIPTTRALELCLKGIKGATAVEANRLIGRTGRFWQPDSYDHIVRSLEQLSAYREYIARNPEMAGITLPSKACYRADWMDDWS